MHYVAHSGLVGKGSTPATVALVCAFFFRPKECVSFFEKLRLGCLAFVWLHMPVIDDREHVMRLSYVYCIEMNAYASYMHLDSHATERSGPVSHGALSFFF